MSRELTPRLVEDIPSQLEEGVLYVSVVHDVVVHLCACGCGTKTVTPLHPGDWTLSYDGAVSLSPSVGNGQLPCRSHYLLRRNRVHWLPRISAAATQRALRRDQQAHASQPPVAPQEAVGRTPGISPEHGETVGDPTENSPGGRRPGSALCRLVGVGVVGLAVLFELATLGAFVVRAAQGHAKTIESFVLLAMWLPLLLVLLAHFLARNSEQVHKLIRREYLAPGMAMLLISKVFIPRSDGEVQHMLFTIGATLVLSMCLLGSVRALLEATSEVWYRFCARRSARSQA